MTLVAEKEEDQILAAAVEPGQAKQTAPSCLSFPNLHEDELQHLGTEAIEQLACGLNKAAITIQEFGQNVSLLQNHIFFKWLKQDLHWPKEC